ncbi:MAG TPA: pilus assembly protein TadG-related protein [Acidimicrobiales bacterium]
MRRDDAGTVSVFVVTLSVALLAAVGLVFDGGRLVDARFEAADVAADAARVGAQEVAAVRAGGRQLDPNRAERAARDHLAAVGRSGQVIATPTGVTVTVSLRRDFTLLRLVGLNGRTVTAVRSSRPLSG